MTTPLAILEGPRHFGHKLVADGLLIPMPCPRLYDIRDNDIHTVWGNDQYRLIPVAHAAIDIYCVIPQEQRWLHIIGALRRSGDRRFGNHGRGEWTATRESILAGLLKPWPIMPVAADIKLLHDFMRVLLSANVPIRGIWADIEEWPCFENCNTGNPDQDDYADILAQWQLATRGTPEQFSEVCLRARYNSLCAVADAFGLSDVAVCVPGYDGYRGSHAINAASVDEASDEPRICKVDAKATPEDFAANLALAESKGCEAVFVWAEEVTAEQLETHRAALGSLQ